MTPFSGSIQNQREKITVHKFSFNGAKTRGLVGAASERKMKIIVPKNSALPFEAQ